jgi:hypothetical protein
MRFLQLFGDGYNEHQRSRVFRECEIRLLDLRLETEAYEVAIVGNQTSKLWREDAHPAGGLEATRFSACPH